MSFFSGIKKLWRDGIVVVTLLKVAILRIKCETLLLSASIMLVFSLAVNSRRANQDELLLA